MHVEFSLESKDLFRMLKHIHTGQYPFRNFFFYSLSVFCLFFAIYNLTVPGNDVKMFYLVALLPIFYMVFLPLALSVRARNMWKKEEYFQKKFKYKFDSEGIHVTSAAGKGLVEWSTLRKVHQTKDDFIFYVARAQAFIVPIKSMDSSRIEELRELLQKSLSEDKLKI